MRIRQLETTMFQNLYLMTMGGSQTNLQIQQQAGLISNLQTQQMNLMYSMFTQRPTFGHGCVVNPHYFPQNPSCFYPNLSIPVNAPYSMPYSTHQAHFQVPLLSTLVFHHQTCASHQRMCEKSQLVATYITKYHLLPNRLIKHTIHTVVTQVFINLPTY